MNGSRGVTPKFVFFDRKSGIGIGIGISFIFLAGPVFALFGPSFAHFGL